VRPPEVIATPRLLLRKPVVPDDAPRIFSAYAHDPDSTHFLAWRPQRNVEEVLATLRLRVACWGNGSEFSWVITTRAKGVLMGMISATPDRAPWRFSLGYVLGSTHWNRGYMTEAVIGVTETLLALPGICRISAVVDEENFASMRVLEKAGMQREGLLQRWSLHPAISDLPRACWMFAKAR
jgi:ribosomal-protein-alanine N-acetyltransferase